MIRASLVIGATAVLLVVSSVVAAPPPGKGGSGASAPVPSGPAPHRSGSGDTVPAPSGTAPHKGIVPPISTELPPTDTADAPAGAGDDVEAYRG